MERGLRAPLSPHEEVTFRRIALGISKAVLLPARDVGPPTKIYVERRKQVHIVNPATGRLMSDEIED